jgi:hypothetical protein
MLRLMVTRIDRLLLAIALIVPGARHAEKSIRSVSIDTEHIFGFTEGADVGEMGQRELENTFTGLFGKPGNYAALRNETAFRYDIADGLRLSLGVTFDYHSIRGAPNLDDHTGFGFSGVTGELRWQVLRLDCAPLEVALSMAPQWQRSDDMTGQQTESYSLPLTLVADIQPVAATLFAALNLTVAPNYTRLDDGWQRETRMEASVAEALALAPGLFLGAEVRHLNHNRQGFLTGHALYVGPSLYVNLPEGLAVKVAWSIQVPDETTGTLDLVNYEGNQVRLQLVKGF